MAAAAFVLTLAFGGPYVGFLRRAGLGKQVRGEGPSSHVWKTGTPTLGGVLFVGITLTLTAVVTVLLYRDSGHSILLPTTVMLLVAVLGAYDDKLSLVGNNKGGLRARTKFGLLGLIAATASIVLWHPVGLGIDSLFIPGQPTAFNIGW